MQMQVRPGACSRLGLSWCLRPEGGPQPETKLAGAGPATRTATAPGPRAISINQSHLQSASAFGSVSAPLTTSRLVTIHPPQNHQIHDAPSLGPVSVNVGASVSPTINMAYIVSWSSLRSRTATAARTVCAQAIFAVNSSPYSSCIRDETDHGGLLKVRQEQSRTCELGSDELPPRQL